MGIRETLNKNPGITTGVTAAIVVIALIIIIMQLSGGGQPAIPDAQYYTVDDGATYFADDINLIPPYQKDGKDAVKAHVFKCEGSEPFVAFLERYTPDAKAKIEKARGSNNPADFGMIEEATMMGVEVKKPGDAKAPWVRQMDPRAAQVTRLTCPDGTTESLEPVLP